MWSGSAAARATNKAHQSVLLQENGMRKVKSSLFVDILSRKIYSQMHAGKKMLKVIIFLLSSKYGNKKLMTV